MDMQKLNEANNLVATIKEMKTIEDQLRRTKIPNMEIRIIRDGMNDTWISQQNGGAFVVEKMIEAGFYALMTVRAAAENDLEKL